MRQCCSIYYVGVLILTQVQPNITIALNISSKLWQLYNDSAQVYSPYRMLINYYYQILLLFSIKSILFCPIKLSVVDFCSQSRLSCIGLQTPREFQSLPPGHRTLSTRRTSYQASLLSLNDGKVLEVRMRRRQGLAEVVSLVYVDC